MADTPDKNALPTPSEGQDRNTPAAAPAGPAPASASLKPVDDGRDPPAGDMPHAVTDLTSAEASSAPGMPHERDETVGMTGGIQSERIEQARVDLEQGREDTSRGTEADRTYQRQKKGG